MTTSSNAAARRPVKTLGLTHLNLAVKDPETSAEFYRRVFGARVLYQDGDSIEVQTPGSHDVIAFTRNPSRAGKRGGIEHFGFRLQVPQDVEVAVRAVEAAGGRILRRGEFSRGHPFVYVQDPDGYEIEIWYE